jgi:hypothetical protein
MTRLLSAGLLLAALVAACGPADPLAGIKKDYPGAAEYLKWKNYALVRFTEQDDGTQPALLLQKDTDGWRVLGDDSEGFISVAKVIGLIPELDESGTRALKLRSQ